MHPLAIGIPTRNRRDMLLELLDDIVQYAPDIPVVISDNSPDDDTETAIALYETRLNLNYIHVKESFSQAENFNFLLSNMETEYALLMHDDDLFFPYSINHYLAIIDFLKDRNLKPFGVYVNGQKFRGEVPPGSEDEQCQKDMPGYVEKHLRLFDRQAYLNYFVESCWGGRAAGVLVNRAALVEHRLEFPTDVGAKHDKAFFLMANRLGYVAEWQKPIIAVRLHGGRSIHRKTSENYVLFNRKIERIYADEPTKIAQIHRKRFQKWQYSEPRFMPLNCLRLLAASQISLFEKVGRFSSYLMRHTAHSFKSVLVNH